MPPGPFKKWDLTQDWGAPTDRLDMDIDLDSYRLMGLALGDAFDRLRPLGKPSASFPIYDDAKKHIVGSDYVWLERGLTVRVRSQDRLESWDVDLGDNPQAVVRYQDRVVPLATMSAASVKAAFGPPAQEGDNPTSFLLYEVPTHHVAWMLDFDDQGRVTSLAFDPLE